MSNFDIIKRKKMLKLALQTKLIEKELLELDEENPGAFSGPASENENPLVKGWTTSKVTQSPDSSGASLSPASQGKHPTNKSWTAGYTTQSYSDWVNGLPISPKKNGMNKEKLNAFFNVQEKSNTPRETIVSSTPAQVTVPSTSSAVNDKVKEKQPLGLAAAVSKYTRREHFLIENQHDRMSTEKLFFEEKSLNLFVLDKDNAKTFSNFIKKSQFVEAFQKFGVVVPMISGVKSITGDQDEFVSTALAGKLINQTLYPIISVLAGFSILLDLLVIKRLDTGDNGILKQTEMVVKEMICTEAIVRLVAGKNSRQATAQSFTSLRTIGMIDEELTCPATLQIAICRYLQANGGNFQPDAKIGQTSLGNILNSFKDNVFKEVVDLMSNSSKNDGNVIGRLNQSFQEQIAALDCFDISFCTINFHQNYDGHDLYNRFENKIEAFRERWQSIVPEFDDPEEWVEVVRKNLATKLRARPQRVSVQRPKPVKPKRQAAPARNPMEEEEEQTDSNVKRDKVPLYEFLDAETRARVENNMRSKLLPPPFDPGLYPEEIVELVKGDNEIEFLFKEVKVIEYNPHLQAERGNAKGENVFRRWVKEDTKRCGVMVASNLQLPGGSTMSSGSFKPMHTATTQEESLLSWITTFQGTANDKVIPRELSKLLSVHGMGLPTGRDSDFLAIDAGNKKVDCRKPEPSLYKKEYGFDFQSYPGGQKLVDHYLSFSFGINLHKKSLQERKDNDNKARTRKGNKRDSVYRTASDVDDWQTIRKYITLAITTSLVQMNVQKVKRAIIAPLSCGIYSGEHKSKIRDNFFKISLRAAADAREECRNANVIWSVEEMLCPSFNMLNKNSRLDETTKYGDVEDENELLRDDHPDNIIYECDEDSDISSIAPTAPPPPWTPEGRNKIGNDMNNRNTASFGNGGSSSSSKPPPRRKPDPLASPQSTKLQKVQPSVATVIPSVTKSPLPRTLNNKIVVTVIPFSVIGKQFGLNHFCQDINTKDFDRIRLCPKCHTFECKNDLNPNQTCTRYDQIPPEMCRVCCKWTGCKNHHGGEYECVKSCGLCGFTDHLTVNCPEMPWYKGCYLTKEIVDRKSILRRNNPELLERYKFVFRDGTDIFSYFEGDRHEPFTRVFDWRKHGDPIPLSKVQPKGKDTPDSLFGRDPRRHSGFEDWTCTALPVVRRGIAASPCEAERGFRNANGYFSHLKYLYFQQNQLFVNGVLWSPLHNLYNGIANLSVPPIGERSRMEMAFTLFNAPNDGIRHFMNAMNEELLKRGVR